MIADFDYLQIRIEFRVGLGYTQALEIAQELACKCGCEVIYGWNDKDVLVHCNSNIPDMVAEFYQSLMQN